MKNSQKGFIVPLLLAIIALLIVGGGVYVYENKKVEAPSSPSNNETQLTAQTSDTNVQNESDSLTSTSNWIMGTNMDYPADVTMTPAVQGTQQGPTYTFLSSYFSGSSIQSAKVSSASSCGNDTPATNITIRGLAFYKSADGLTYDLPGACNNSFRLTIVVGSSTDANSTAYQNLKNIFYTMIDSMAQKLSVASAQNNVPAASGVSVPNMTQYTDSNFGFSFWYPSGWRMLQAFPNSYIPLSGGTVEKIIGVGDPQYPNSGVGIEEFVSSSTSITDSSNCGPAEGCGKSITFFFDSSAHTWFAQKTNFDNSTAASVALTNFTNTMGGLHLLYGNARFGDDIIIPLSAEHFLVVFAIDAGGTQEGLLANTITATDPSVATPVSADEQIQTIIKEGLLYGALGTSLNHGSWYLDGNNVYDSEGNLVVGVNAKTFTSITRDSDGSVSPDASFGTDGTYVYSNYTGISTVILAGADPATFVLIKAPFAIEEDKSHIWLGNKLIPGANPSTFVVDTDEKLVNGILIIGKDASHVYGQDVKGNITVDGVIVQP